MAYGTTGFLAIDGQDIGQKFAAYTSGNKAATSNLIASNGNELSNILTPLVGSQTIPNTGVLTAAGRDCAAVYGSVPSNAPLPINGQRFNCSSQSGSTTSIANLTFAVSSSTWTLYGTATPTGNVPTTQSGSVPSGAAYVQYSASILAQIGSASFTNQASSNTPLSSNPLFNCYASSTPSTADNEAAASLTINFLNSSGQTISTTTISMYAIATGSS